MGFIVVDLVWVGGTQKSFPEEREEAVAVVGRQGLEDLGYDCI